MLKHRVCVLKIFRLIHRDLMFIPKDMLIDVATNFPHEMCVAYMVVIMCDILLSLLYLSLIAQLPPVPEGDIYLFSTYLWWWLLLPILFSVPGTFVSFRALQFYQRVQSLDVSKTTEYILNENFNKMVNATWWLRKCFVAWNTITLVILMHPNIRNDIFLSAVWKLSVLCASWTALKKIIFAVFFNGLSHRSLWSIRYRITRLAPKWNLDASHANIGECCMVCHSSFQSKDVVRTLPCLCHQSKGRIYHKDCIDKWLIARYDFCPVCSHKVFEQTIHDIH